MIKYLSFVIILCYLFNFSNSLRWTKSGFSATPDTVISMMVAKSTPLIDVSAGKQVTIIRNTKVFERGFIILCFISGHNNNTRIEYSFCKDSSCYSVADGTSSNNIKNFNFDLKFETNFPNKKGLRIGLALPSNAGTTTDFSGSYYCKANNNNFAIRSNNIEIRDTIYWGLNLFIKIDSLVKTSIQYINQSTLPQVLNCSDGTSQQNPAAPRWTKIEFFSPMQWYVCPILKSDQAQSEKNKMSAAKCAQYSKDKCDENINNDICPLPVSKQSDWTSYINQNGNLIITELRPTTSTTIDSYSLMCNTKDKSENFMPIFYFYVTASEPDITKGITFDGITKAVSHPLTAISPLVQDFIIYARQIPSDVDTSSVKAVAIYALFKSSPEATYQWKYGNTQLNSNNIMKVAKYTVTFPGDITSDIAGTYTLEVIDKIDKITMEMRVRVLGPPIIVMDACMIPLLYVWDGGQASFSCEYKQRPSTIKLQINSQEIKLGDPLENSKANLKSSNPYLEQLSFSMSPNLYVESDTVVITYSVYNLTRSQGQTKYQDHTVTFLADNDFGISVKSTSIYVIPHLKTIVTDFPEKYNCTSPCSSALQHTFNCAIKMEEYANKELIVEYYWTINSHRLGVETTDSSNIFARYFTVNPYTNQLTMQPIKSNETDIDKKVKDALKNNFIECNVNLLPTSPLESDFRYYSSLDKTLGSTMQAKITLDYEAINTASLYWIIAVILGLIVLIILIVFIVRYCMKNKGETYPLDKLEREHGYDPDKEVQEEVFKPYERQEHDPEATLSDGPERRLSISGRSVGSNDDGELDNYDLDPSNFNEDGSMIGKYSANPRSRAEMT